MKIPLSMLVIVALFSGHAESEQKGVATEKWPDFIPLSQLSDYVGLEYPTPQLSHIYGGQSNLDVIVHADHITVVRVSPTLYASDFSETSPSTVGINPVFSISSPIDDADREMLITLLQDYDTYGDKTLCPFHADTGLRFSRGDAHVDVMIGLDCGEVGIFPTGSVALVDARLADPSFMKFAQTLFEKYKE